MTTSIGRLCLIFAFLVPGVLLAQPAQQGVPQGRDNSQFVVFLHGGRKSGEKPIEVETLRAIGAVLVRKGYVVRAPDFEVDLVGGPGVDYFSDFAGDPAKDVADTVNATLKNLELQTDDTKALKPRRQNQKNPIGYLGVWLF
jgi:hypothetical protein